MHSALLLNSKQKSQGRSMAISRGEGVSRSSLLPSHPAILEATILFPDIKIYPSFSDGQKTKEILVVCRYDPKVLLSPVRQFFVSRTSHGTKYRNIKDILPVQHHHPVHPYPSPAPPATSAITDPSCRFVNFARAFSSLSPTVKVVGT